MPQQSHKKELKPTDKAHDFVVPGQWLQQGFGFPLGAWMRTDLAGVLKHLLGNSRFAELGIFEQQQINAIMNEHIDGKADHSYRLWILLNLEILQRLYFEGATLETTAEMLRSHVQAG